MENNLENLYDKMLDEAPFNFKVENKPYIFELAKIYATECVKESLKQADKRVKSSWKCSPATAIIVKKSILDNSNITLL